MNTAAKTNNLFPDISVDNPQEDFAKFLGREGNKRIFFSAAYGTGKTYFLKKFFENNKEEYDVYHLFPVRYQVSSNEDIIRLLKCDIFVELSKKHKDAMQAENKRSKEEQKNIPIIKNMANKIYNFGESTVAVSSLVDVLPALEVLGRSIGYIKHIEAFVRWIDSVYRNQPEYISETKDISAPDKFSYLLQKLISRSKSGKNKSVLILDDLDRIDPDHIFRLLNIFSAHDLTNEDNKFGFDYVIIVGCMDNIKSIYQHRYGIGAEFDGYFDKFYSTIPYIFDNKKAVAATIHLLIQPLPDLNQNIQRQAKSYLQQFLYIYIHASLDMKIIRLRQIYKRIGDVDRRLGINIYGGNYTNIAIRLYRSFFPSNELFLANLRKIMENSNYVNYGVNNINTFAATVVKNILIDIGYGGYDDNGNFEVRDDHTKAEEIQKGIADYEIKFESNYVDDITIKPIAAMSYFIILYYESGL